MKWRRPPGSVSAIALALYLLCSCNTEPSGLTVGYVQITPDPVLEVARTGLFRALSDSGLHVGQQIQLMDLNAQGDLSMITSMLQSCQARNPALIITSGTPCMFAAAQQVQETPVVFTVSFAPQAVGLKQVPGNLYGAYDPLLAGETVALIQECLPEARKVGIPFNNAEPNAVFSADVFRKELEKAGLEVLTASVTSPNDIMMAGQYLTGQQVDLILVAADNTTYLGLNTLARVAADSRTPLFVTDPIQAEKGASVGFGVNYDQWGYQSGLLAVEILRGRVPQPPIQPITQYELIINEKACREQGWSVPGSVRERAERLIE